MPNVIENTFNKPLSFKFQNLFIEYININFDVIFAILPTTAKYHLPPKGGRFCENNFLKFLISSQPIIKRRSLICGRRG